MQSIGQIQSNSLAERSSKTDHIARPIPVEKQRALGDVFDRWRLNNGWNPWDNKTQMAAISSFVPTLDAAGVPPEHYNALYERMLFTRVALIQSGKSLPNFGVEMLIAEWPALRAELNQRRIDEGRTLTVSAQTQCVRCHGTEMETITRDGKIFVRPGCKHEMVEDAEETTKGFDAAINAVKREYVPETSLDILKRCQRLASHAYATAINAEAGEAAWSGTVILNHAERYVRDNPEF